MEPPLSLFTCLSLLKAGRGQRRKQLMHFKGFEIFRILYCYTTASLTYNKYRPSN
jgi:hypothetical protein